MFTNNVTNPTDNQYQRKEILSVKEACAYMDISKSYIYKLTHGRMLPFFCPNGKLIYFKRSDLDAWMMQNHQLSKSEVKALATNFLAQRKGGYHG
jgi:excisionase family DNA binding protein